MTTPILLVEDEENDAFFMQRAMKKAGIVGPIRVASDGRQAIDYLQSALRAGGNGAFPLPGLVLLDLKLPYVMGLDVLKWIRQQSELAPIVLVLSASSELEDIATAYHLGANAYLIKPSELRQLDAMVKSLKDFWLTHNTPPAQPNLERVVAGLAQSCRHQVQTASHRDPQARGGQECPPYEGKGEDLVALSLRDLPRNQTIHPLHCGASVGPPIDDSVEQRIIDTLKTSPQAKSYRPSV